MTQEIHTSFCNKILGCVSDVLYTVSQTSELTSNSAAVSTGGFVHRIFNTRVQLLALQQQTVTYHQILVKSSIHVMHFYLHSHTVLSAKFTAYRCRLIQQQ